jgi:hypothetical protein
MVPKVLKKRHSLKGLSLLPIIRQLREAEPNSIKEYARISAAKQTEIMLEREVIKAVLDITGEPATDLLELAGEWSYCMVSFICNFVHCCLMVIQI